MPKPDIGEKRLPPEEMSGYTYMTNDLCVSRDALVLYGYSVQNNGNNAVVTFHEGRNALAPILVVHNSLGGQCIPFWFNRGIELDNGLFVDMDGCTTSVTVYWRPRREREAG